MDYKVVMPRLSDSMDEGQLIEWKIRPGDMVKNGDVIAEVESDKAVMEIQTFKSGTVKELLIEPGSTVAVGTPMAVIETAGTGERNVQNLSQSHSDEHPEEAKSERIRTEAASKQQPEIKNDTLKETPEVLDILLTRDTEEHSSYRGGNASPRARALASKYGLDIEKLQAEKHLPVPAHFEDIRAYWLKRYFTPKALALISRYHLSTDLFEKGKKHDEAEVRAYIQSHEIPLPQPLDMLHKAMIGIVNEAVKKPVYHMSDHIDAGLLNSHVTKELTITVWLINLFGEAMMRHKYFRMTLAAEGIQIWPNASVSLAMAHGEYLYMPVFRMVNKKSLREIADELQGFKEKIANRALAKEDLTGSTFGISNLGMTGVEQFDAMINRDDCAIAAIGAERENRISVTLTVDHRIINGYQAATFMQTLKELALDEGFFKAGYYSTK